MQNEVFICRDFFNYIFAEWRGRVVKFNLEAVSFQLVQFNCFCNSFFFSVCCRCAKLLAVKCKFNFIERNSKVLQALATRTYRYACFHAKRCEIVQTPIISHKPG